MYISNNANAYIEDGEGTLNLSARFISRAIHFNPRTINGNNIGMFQYQTMLITNFYNLLESQNANTPMLQQVPTFFNGFQLENAFADCHNLPVAFVGWDNIYEECEDYYEWNNTGINVKYLNYEPSTENMFHNCYNMQGEPKIFRDLAIVTSKGMYENCYNITGNPVFARVTEDISRMYYGCNNLNGEVSASLIATNMAETFYNCTNLNGAVFMPITLENMYRTYYNCVNVHGLIPNVSKNVNLVEAFYNTNISIPVNFTITNSTNLSGTFSECQRVNGTMFLTSVGSVNAHNCFYNRDVNTRLNIVVTNGGDWENWFLNVATPCGDTPLTWVESATKYVNAEKNIYLYSKGFTPYNDNVISLNMFNLDVNTRYLEFVEEEGV